MQELFDSLKLVEEFLGGLVVKGSGIVSAMAWVWSLAWELLIGEGKKKKKKKKKTGRKIL